MDDVRVGRIVRALRRRRSWTQARLGAMASVGQSTVSLLERGQAESMSLRVVRRILRVLEAEATLELRWRGGEIDRLLDEGHARLVAAVVQWLHGFGWETAVEVTYSVYGERGSIDVVGWRGLERALLVVEVKRELLAAESTLRKHDEMVRLAPQVVAERFGWQSRFVSRLLALPDTTAARHRVAAGDGLIAESYPVHGVALRHWLRAPTGRASAVVFFRNIDVSAGKRRIRSSRTTAAASRPVSRAQQRTDG